MRLFTVMAAMTLVACDGGTDVATDDTDSDTPEATRVDDVLALTPDLVSGATLYDSGCSSCHLADGTGDSSGGLGTDLTLTLPNLLDRAAVSSIIDGVPGSIMTSYGDFYTDQEVADVTGYIYDAFGE